MIIEITPQTIYRVQLGEEYPNVYYRFGAECWMVEYGCSLEEYYACEDLEAEFQEILKTS